MSDILYRPVLGPILASGFRPGPAIGFYLLQTAAIVIFPLGLARSRLGAFAFGALYGAASYAVYDLTNWATLKYWSATLTGADIGWGAFVTGCAAAGGFFARTWSERAALGS